MKTIFLTTNSAKVHITVKHDWELCIALMCAWKYFLYFSSPFCILYFVYFYFLFFTITNDSWKRILNSWGVLSSMHYICIFSKVHFNFFFFPNNIKGEEMIVWMETAASCNAMGFWCLYIFYPNSGNAFIRE